MEEFNFSDSEVELEVLPQKATPLKHEMIEVKNDTFKQKKETDVEIEAE